MSQLPSSESHSAFATSTEGMVLLLSEKMATCQRDINSANTKLDTMASTQATRSAIADLGVKFDKFSDKMEERISKLEEWKTGISAQLKLSYLFAGAVATLASIAGHFWK